MDVKAAARPGLNTFYAYLTSGCNCACQHCWIVKGRSSRTAGEYDYLDLATLRHAIGEALPLGLNAIKWTGGEPTLHPEFRRFVALQKEFALDGILETNGMLIDVELAQFMREHGVGSVSVSLDGANAAIHDRIRATHGGFDRTIAGIKALVTAGYQPELILTLQRTNVDDLPAFFRLAEELGAGGVKLNIVQPVLRGAELVQQGDTLAIRELLELARRTEEVWSEEYDLQINMDLPMAFRPLGGLSSGHNCGVCAIQHVLGILPRGDYALCGIGEHVEALAMGQILKTPLAHLWETHPVLVALRDQMPDKLAGICADCLMKTACRGSCVAANYHLSGDLFAPYWFCTQAEQQGLFPASRRRKKTGKRLE